MRHPSITNIAFTVNTFHGSYHLIAKMFVYLNSCPALHWQNFYHHLLFEKTNSEMILSVLNAMKNSRTKGSREVANKVLVRLADILGFQYKHFANETTWVNSIATVKG